MKIKNGYWVETAEEIAKHGCVIVEDNGLILGNTHSEGGIYFFIPEDEDGEILICAGEIEGGEYITSRYTDYLHMEKVKEFNSYTTDAGYIAKGDYADIKGLPIYDLRNTDKVLVFNRRISIINHCATKKFINELVELDKLSKEEYNNHIRRG